MPKLLRDTGLRFAKSVRESRRDIALAFVFPAVAPLLFDVVRILPAALIVLFIMVAMGARIRLGAVGVLAVLALTALLSLAWNALFYVAALRTRNPQTPMAMQPMFLPFVFLSSIYMPYELLPAWTQNVADFNPLTS
jgi:ABC-2 type transport system permease protein